MTKLTALLNEVAGKAIREGATSALQINISDKNKTLFQKSYGSRNYHYFDLASITKFFVTTPVIMLLVQDKKLSLDSHVGNYLKMFDHHPIGKIKIKNLLNQTSGLEWWKPFYKTLLKVPSLEREYQLKKLFLLERLKNKSQAVYSDLNFILLKWVIEEVTHTPLDLIFETRIATPLDLSETFFIRSGKIPGAKSKNKFAPTEKTKERGIVQGIVNDDNAWSFGGVSGHAGLFSTLDETSKMAREFLKIYAGESSLINKTIFRSFAKRAIAKRNGDWALGFMIPSRPMSTGGSKISTESFGFPGFTGPSVWIDTKRGVAITILANRTYPKRDNARFAPVRREIHDIIWESLDDKI